MCLITLAHLWEIGIYLQAAVDASLQFRKRLRTGEFGGCAKYQQGCHQRSVDWRLDSQEEVASGSDREEP